MSRLHLSLSLVAFLATSLPIHAQEPDVIEERFYALEEMIQSTTDADLKAYLEAEIDGSLLEVLSEEDLMEHLREVRQHCRNFGGILLVPSEEGLGFRMRLETGLGWFQVDARLSDDPPHRVVDLAFEEIEAPERQELEPFTWDTLDERLDAFDDAGFRGSVLMVRDGETFLERHFGSVDAEGRRPINENTAFAVGSMPIDFTRAAILKLVDQGLLRLNDPITKHLEGVPADKRGMTLDHLMNGRSGLRNFHGIRGVDYDLDLAWVDRATALERILGSELLFEPGQGRVHSHSAFGVLAAIVEIVSEKSFIEFVREYFLEPCGMTRTGNYEDTSVFAEDVAMGTPAVRHDQPNYPMNWGPTSWLVMGSGGMVSCPRDLRRFVEAMRGGELLSPESTRLFATPGVLEGGNDRGFLCSYNEGPRTMFFVCSASHTGGDDDSGLLARTLWELVQQSLNPFVLGLSFGVDEGEGGEISVVVHEIVRGGAAEEAGLQAGDRVLSIGGRKLVDVEAQLRSLGRSGEVVVFGVERAGEDLEFRVRPRVQ